MVSPAPLARSAILSRVLSSACRQIRQYSAPADRAIPQAKQKYVPTSGTYPKGFLAGSAFAGVKASNTKYDDVALVVSEDPCPAAVVVTKNLFKAAPCAYNKSLFSAAGPKLLRGVVVNSGCANAVTGSQGYRDASAMAESVNACFSGISPFKKESTLVMSTGVIGQPLPIDKITGAIPKAHASLGATHEDWMRAAQAICTTDTFPKLLTRTFTLPSHPDTTYSIAGMTKGAGMIAPNMGTLLGIICTDVKIDPNLMKHLLRFANQRSFNRITIDGDTSTNDTIAFFANGAATPSDLEGITSKNPELFKGRHQHNTSQLPRVLDSDGQAFYDVLQTFMLDLAKLVVRDGEGATKFVTVRVQSDISTAICTSVAASIARSSLVKTALYGNDANWGRILCAVGYTPRLMKTVADQRMAAASTGDLNKKRYLRPAADITLQRTTVQFVPSDGSDPLTLLFRGEPADVDEARAKEILEMEDIEIFVKLNDDADEDPDSLRGSLRGILKERQYSSTVYTCDLSHEYVTINGDYRT